MPAAQDRLEVFAAACPYDEQALSWYPDSSAPVTYGQLWAARRAQGTYRVSWRDLEVRSVQIHDDLVLVFYAVTWSPQAAAGDLADARSRRLQVLRRRDGVWILAGASIAPAG